MTISSVRWFFRGLPDFLRRPRCYLTGCRTSTFRGYLSSRCDRCGSELYDGWIEATLWDPLQSWWYDFTARLKPRRCAGCGGWIGWRFRGQAWPDFCSPECEDGWIPF